MSDEGAAVYQNIIIIDCMRDFPINFTYQTGTEYHLHVAVVDVIVAVAVVVVASDADVVVDDDGAAV